jgi:hypothetical protein
MSLKKGIRQGVPLRVQWRKPMARNKGCDQSQKSQPRGEEWPKSGEWKQFEEEFNDPDNPSGAAFLAFTRRRLKQFHLDGFCSSAEILSETYIRVAKLIKG